ncbi:hypothetical protein CQW23_26364 [Capsicum baccatum]|uniref:Uncharacterized protein n=1 Tax=Capsicum baccatum TaxID=33114 RepID=A0A2G2VNL0_CAPBA|nr:hypothetical protein CQW23_26364 [Capsicum baccatum]
MWSRLLLTLAFSSGCDVVKSANIHKPKKYWSVLGRLQVSSIITDVLLDSLIAELLPSKESWSEHPRFASREGNERKQVEQLLSCSDDVGYGESETVDLSMQIGNMLLGSEGSVEIFQLLDNQNYKEGGTFEDSNITKKFMEIKIPFKERKYDESVDLGSSTMSKKGIMILEQSVERYVNCYS